MIIRIVSVTFMNGEAPSEMDEELVVILNRRDPRDDPSIGLGFSLLDKPGFPPVIYDIEENSPAAECGKVSILSCLYSRIYSAIRTSNCSYRSYEDTVVAGMSVARILNRSTATSF